MFLLFIGGTEMARIPGLTSAGANPDVLPLTAPADADLIRFGRPKSVDCFPMDPEGHPTPAIITRAAAVEAGFPVCVVRAGSFLPPAPPYVELGTSPGKDARVEPAVPDAREIFESASFLAKNTDFARDEPAFLAECVPAGTTTALMVLRALGYEHMVSSGGNVNPVSLKERLWSECSSRVGIKAGGLGNEPLRAITELGDPMQAAVAGFVMGLDAEVEVILAGGTQMLAVAACLKAMNCPRKLKVATTKYVAEDGTSSFLELAGKLGVETYIAPYDFSGSAHKGLRDYEAGYVKEGDGAGGAALYASLKGIGADCVIARTESLYGEFANAKKR
jgi:uncharacterized protein (TIGR00303 family)